MGLFRVLRELGRRHEAPAALLAPQILHGEQGCIADAAAPAARC
jgi:hypothetical protein